MPAMMRVNNKGQVEMDEVGGPGTLSLMMKVWHASNNSRQATKNEALDRTEVGSGGGEGLFPDNISRYSNQNAVGDSEDVEWDPVVRGIEEVDDEDKDFVDQVIDTFNGPKYGETDEDRYNKEQALFAQIPDMDKEKPGKKAGSIGFNNAGELIYCEKGKPNWERAVFHHWIRDGLAELANQDGSYPQGQSFQREDGLLPGDTTCFHPLQQFWGAERNDYAPIMFRFRKDGRPNPGYVAGGIEANDLVVIDYWHLVVRGFEEFPVVLSSKYKGEFMEPAQRQNANIKHHDFRARMPPIMQLKSHGRSFFKPTPKQNALAAQMRRFREKSGSISWTAREDTDRIVKFMNRRFPDQATRVSNSTREMNDLSKAELSKLRLLNLGRKPNRGHAKASAKAKEAYVADLKKRAGSKP